jgi:hypothetical protein
LALDTLLRLQMNLRPAGNKECHSSWKERARSAERQVINCTLQINLIPAVCPHPLQ